MENEEEQQQEPQVDVAEVSDEDRMAALMSGISGNRSTAAPTESEAPAEQQPEPETPAAPTPRYRQITEDEFAELTARTAKVSDLEAAQKRDRDAIYGSIGALKQSVSRQGAPLPKDKLDALRLDMPDVAELLEVAAQSAPVFDHEAVLKSAEERLKPQLEAVREQARQEALTLARQEMRAELLSQQHSDWRDVTVSAEFQAHAKAKGDTFLSTLAHASDTWDYRFIGAAISEFKAGQKKAADSASARRERLASNVNPRGSAAPSQAPPTGDEAFTAGLRKVSGQR